MEAIYKLKGVIQHYSWGGTTFIPQLLNYPNKDQSPCAEYWLGAHPNAPAQLTGTESLPLDKFIEQNALAVLGKRVSTGFGSLPYLFKVLDVRQMLSIQVHPSKESAKIEFEKENKKGIPLTAPHRNYKDQNHKPELMVALSGFWLLHGFKPAEDLRLIFEGVPELSFLQKSFDEGGYKQLYQLVMTIPQEEVNRVLAPLVNRILPLYQNGQLQKGDEHFWAARAFTSFCKHNNYDRGIFSIYLFNLLHVKEGEGIYQAAGLPHAYLEGQNIEVMANSDNVLRAGLTDKHVDVVELMKHVKFEPTIPHILANANKEKQIFESPAREFELTKYRLTKGVDLVTESATILLVYEGGINISTLNKKLTLSRGEAALLVADAEVSFAPAESATVFAVTTPVHKK